MENSIILKDRQQQYLVNKTDIIYAKGDGSYSTTHLCNGKRICCSLNLSELTRILNNTTDFVRTHNSFVVNIQQMKSFNHSQGIIIMKNNCQVPVSRRRKPEVMKCLRRYAAIGEVIIVGYRQQKAKQKLNKAAGKEKKSQPGSGQK